MTTSATTLDTAIADQPVLQDTIGRVSVITLNRPRARNALNTPLLDALDQHLSAAMADPAIGAVMLTANGPAFCAGADLKETASAMDSGDFWAQHERASRSLRIHQQLPRMPKPIVAAVNGTAVAGGCGIAMSCDLVIASDQAKFGYPEINRGLAAAMVMVGLTKLVGRRHAMDLLLSGRLVDGDEAVQMGLINSVVPHGELYERALTYTSALAEKSPSALRITKDLYRNALDMDYDRALEYARDVNMMLRQTKDARAGAHDFVSKRANS